MRGGHDALRTQACEQFRVYDCDLRAGDACFAGCDNRDFEMPPSLPPGWAKGLAWLTAATGFCWAMPRSGNCRTSPSKPGSSAPRPLKPPLTLGDV